MKLNLPFFNRKRYIVLNAYTNNKRLLENAPVTLSSLLPPVPFFQDKVKDKSISQKDFNKVPTFRSCYGNVIAAKRSAVVPCWSTYTVTVDNNKSLILDSADMFKALGDNHFKHNEDPYYDTSNFHVLKMSSCWLFEESTGVNFVYAQHIRNNTNMRIPSGLIEFKHQNGVNVFNLVPKHPHTYTIPFKTPLVALYPLSDKPFYVESHYNLEKFAELNASTAARFWYTGNSIKLCK